MNKLEIMGPAEVAAHCNVHITTLSRWLKAGIVPPPDAQLAIGNVWRTTTIHRWWEGQQAAARDAAGPPRAASR